MTRRRIHCWIVPLVLLALLSSSSAVQYVVTGGDKLERAGKVRWAEETGSRLGKLLGKPVPGTGPVVIEVEDDPEHLVRRLLVRVVASRQQAAGLSAPELVIPQWLSEGLARNLDTEKRVRDRKLTARVGVEPRTDSAGDIIRWENLPAWWEGRKALCGSLVTWLLTCPHRIDPVLDRLASGNPVTPEWMAVSVVGVPTVAVMNGLWLDWRRQQEAALQDFGELSLALIDELKTETMLELPAKSTWGAGSADEPARLLHPDEVIVARKRQPGLVAQQAARKMQQIQLLTMGKAPELVEAGDLYSRFYETVAHRGWTLTLKWRLARADGYLQRLESLTLARMAWLDEFEQAELRKAKVGLKERQDEVVPELDKSRIQSYVDDAEKRFHEKQNP